jgi:hypothetical protein
VPTDNGEVILAEARRAIDFQHSSLNELRSRTGLVLAAASVSASFIGSGVVGTGRQLGFLGGLALVAFVIAIASCIRVLMPAQGWWFATSPKTLIEDWVETDRGESSMTLHLARCLEDHHDRNRAKLDDLFIWFQIAAVSVAAEVILGALQVAT